MDFPSSSGEGERKADSWIHKGFFLSLSRQVEQERWVESGQVWTLYVINWIGRKGRTGGNR